MLCAAGKPASPLADVVRVEETRDEQERLVVRASQKLQRALGDAGVVVVLGLAGENLKAMGAGVSRAVTQVPLAAVGGVVTGVAEVGAHAAESLGVKAVPGRRIHGDAGFVRIPPRKDRAPPRHAERIGSVCPREEPAGLCQPVHGRRMDELAAHAATHGVGKLLVGDNEEHIASRRRCLSAVQHGLRGEQQGSGKGNDSVS